MEYVIHKNKTSWGTTWHIITSDGMGHIEACIEDDLPETIFFSGLSVMPEKRHQGIGADLISQAEKIGCSYNAERLRINVEKPDNGLYDWYKKLGYAIWDEDDTYIYMVKYT